jgi:DNA polymerase I-like protein with 3'-5' exonuclease and polymerase domains
VIIRDKTGVAAALKMLNSSLYWSYDIETTGLNVRSDKIIGFGCANPDNLDQAFYIIMKEFNGTELIDVLSDADVLPVIKALKTKRLIGWNFSFDSRFTYHYFNVNLIESIHSDGMLLLHTLDENRQNYQLKPAAAEFLGADSTEAQTKMKESIKANGGGDKDFYKADSNLMATYGLQDNIITCKLYNKFEAELKRQGLYKFFYTDEVMPLLKHVTIPMEMLGIPLDIPLMTETLEHIKADMEALHTDIQAQIAPHLAAFNKWYMDKEYPVKLSGDWFNELATQIASEDWPRTKSKSYSFSAAAFKKKPHLLEHDLMKYYNGDKRIPGDLVLSVQKALHAKSGELYAFNILSKHHLKKLFFEQLGEVATSKTDLGNDQVEDDFLEAMAEKYDWVKKLRTYNKLTKIKSTYIEAYLDKQEGGIFYPSYFQHRTVSGRYGSNLQQLPRPVEHDDGSLEVKYTNLLRKFFISAEGFTFVDDDYESLEPHTFAHVSGDDGLKDIFRKNFDFYSTIAIATEGLTEYSADKKAPNYLGKLNKQARQTAKAYSLGIPYGMGAYALAMNLKDTGMNIDDKGAQRLINSYLNAYPELKKWMQDSKDFACKHGYIRIETGRIRRFPELPRLIEKYKGIDMTNQLDIWKEFNETPNDYAAAKDAGRRIRNYINNARNVQIQGLAASIVNRASIALAKALKEVCPDSYICAQVHDELIVRCKEEKVDIVKQIVQDKLENTYKLSIALKAPPSVGKNFAEAKG